MATSDLGKNTSGPPTVAGTPLGTALPQLYNGIFRSGKPLTLDVPPTHRTRPADLEFMGPLINCSVKTAIGGVTGFAFGGIMGLFLRGMDTPMASGMVDSKTDTSLRGVLTDMRTTFYRSGKYLGLFSAIFSITECSVDSVRSKSDLHGIFISAVISSFLFISAQGTALTVGRLAMYSLFPVAFEIYRKFM